MTMKHINREERKRFSSSQLTGLLLNGQYQTLPKIHWNSRITSSLWNGLTLLSKLTIKTWSNRHRVFKIDSDHLSIKITNCNHKYLPIRAKIVNCNHNSPKYR